MKNLLILGTLLLASVASLQGQLLYFSVSFQTNGLPPNNILFRIDVATCEYCPVLDLPNGSLGIGDVLILPNGDVLVTSLVNGIERFDPPNPVPVATTPGVFFAGYVHPNGTIYLTNSSTLYTFNPSNNTVSVVGNFPSTLNVNSALYYYNGVLYVNAAISATNEPVLLQVNLTDPSASVIVPFPPSGIPPMITSTPNGNIYGTDMFNNITIDQFDPVTGTTTVICDTPLELAVNGMGSAPAGTPDLPCICLGNAATPVQNTVNACVPSSATVNFNNDGEVLPFQVARYILYTNLSNPLGSIVQNNPTPVFNYVPPLQPNVNYYVAQVVGNDVNGNISLTDPCLDLSTPVTVTWRPIPAINTLTANAGALCPGVCQPVTVNLSGTPPFAYSWQVQQNGNVITPLQVVFNVNNATSTFQACVPPNASTGPVQVVICGITDAFCGNP